MAVGYEKDVLFRWDETSCDNVSLKQETGLPVSVGKEVEKQV